VASPDQVVASGGSKWNEIDLTSRTFGFVGAWMDFPDLEFGPNALYLSFNVIGGKHGATFVRIPLDVLTRTRAFTLGFYESRNWYITIAQGSGTRVYFATQNSDSQLRIFYIDEGSTSGDSYTVNISTIATRDWTSLTPNGNDWTTESRINWAIKGATVTGNQLWLAWSAAKDDTRGNHLYKQAHIDMVVIDLRSSNLLAELPLYSNDFAIASPNLATNSAGKIGITFMQGGGDFYVHPAVGIITPQLLLNLAAGGREFRPIMPLTQSIGGSGDYMSVRVSYPNRELFSAAVFDQPKDTSPTWATWGFYNRPLWVKFGSS